MLLLDGEPLQSLGGQAYWSFGGLFLVDSPEQRRLRVRTRPSWPWPTGWAVRRSTDRRTTGRAGGRRRTCSSPPARSGPGCTVSGCAGSRWSSGPSAAATPCRGHGNSVPRFHVTWGTGPGIVQPFADAVLALPPGADPQPAQGDRDRRRRRRRARARCRSWSPARPPAALPTRRPRSGSSPSPPRPWSWPAAASAGTSTWSGRTGRRGYGEPPQTMIAGVPDYVDGSMLEVATRAGGRVINPDRMWHYPEGILNHSPVWTQHGIRILPGPSRAVAGRARAGASPLPLFPGFDALGALRHITASGSRPLLVRARRRRHRPRSSPSPARSRTPT